MPTAGGVYELWDQGPEAGGRNWHLATTKYSFGRFQNPAATYVTETETPTQAKLLL